MQAIPCLLKTSNIPRFFYSFSFSFTVVGVVIISTVALLLFGRNALPSFPLPLFLSLNLYYFPNSSYPLSSLLLLSRFLSLSLLLLSTPHHPSLPPSLLLFFFFSFLSSPRLHFLLLLLLPYSFLLDFCLSPSPLFLLLTIFPYLPPFPFASSFILLDSTFSFSCFFLTPSF